MVSFAVVSTLIASAAALGLNCRGSGACPFHVGDIRGIRFYLRELQKAGKGGVVYPRGAHLACERGPGSWNTICGFFQQTEGTVDQALQAIDRIINNGCKICGSAPIHSPDVKDGEFTVNVVSKPQCCDNCPCWR